MRNFIDQVVELLESEELAPFRRVFYAGTSCSVFIIILVLIAIFGVNAAVVKMPVA